MGTTRKIAGVDCGPECFAYAPEKSDSREWKLCLRVPGDMQKTINQVKNSLSRFHETQGIPAGQRSALFNRLVGAAIVLGIPVAKDPVISVTEEEIDLILAERTANELLGRIDMTEWTQ